MVLVVSSSDYDDCFMFDLLFNLCDFVFVSYLLTVHSTIFSGNLQLLNSIKFVSWFPTLDCHALETREKTQV